MSEINHQNRISNDKRRISNHQKRIYIAGGGISGLAAAFFLLDRWERLGFQTKPEVVVCEASDRLGGIIHTETDRGWVIERGPDSVLTTKPEALALVQALGLQDQIETIPAHGRGAYVWRAGKLRRIPAQFPLGIPTDFQTWKATDLVDVAAKKRVWWDQVLPVDVATIAGDDQTLEEVVLRRLGRDWFAGAVEPLIGGVYAGDPAQLSVQSTFPYLQEALRTSGSLIKGMRKWQIQRKKEQQALIAQGVDPKIVGSAFFTLSGGLKQLLDALEKAILVRGGQVLRQAEVLKITSEQILHFQTGESVAVDALILAMPLHHASRIMGWEHIARPRASVANVVMIWPKADVPVLPAGSGFVVPRSETCPITACTFTSQKWPHTAPDSHMMLRVYIGRFDQTEWMTESDEQLVVRGLQGLQQILGGHWPMPQRAIITRYPLALPQYPVGHRNQVATFREWVRSTTPYVHLIGADFDGVGVPDCIRQAEQLCEQFHSNINLDECE